MELLITIKIIMTVLLGIASLFLLGILKEGIKETGMNTATSLIFGLMLIQVLAIITIWVV